MRIDLTDFTFLLLIRLDSLQRLENVLAIEQQLCRYFKTNIVIREAASYNNEILKSLLSKKVNYEFIEDKDPVLYKTKHFNQMIMQVSTPYLAIWDTDIVVNKKAVMECAGKLRKESVDIAYPYNGVCLDVPDIIKNIFLKTKDIRFLFRQINRMNRLHPHLLVGGAVFLNKEKFIKAGMENEKQYGWGNDDFDRYFRFIGLGYNIHRVDTPLFHLIHPRNSNSKFHSSFYNQLSLKECSKSANSSKKEIETHLKKEEIRSQSIKNITI